jgi:hypothetical protein
MLALAAAEKPSDERKDDAQNDGGGKWKVENRVLAANNKVARQPADWQVVAARDQKHSADDNNDSAQKKQQLTEISHQALL